MGSSQGRESPIKYSGAAKPILIKIWIPAWQIFAPAKSALPTSPAVVQE
jgi:hypothetical protein